MTCCVRAPTLYGRLSVLAVRLLESHLEGEIRMIFKFLHDPLLILLLILDCTQKASFVCCVDSSGRQAVNFVSDGLPIAGAGKMIYKESFSKLQLHSTFFFTSSLPVIRLRPRREPHHCPLPRTWPDLLNGLYSLSARGEFCDHIFPWSDKSITPLKAHLL